jgi:uncharacterized glyoxalase superfamily protein PhnB
MLCLFFQTFRWMTERAPLVLAQALLSYKAQHGIMFRMSNVAKSCVSTVIPALRYRDCPAAIEWLCQAFGFEKHAVYPHPDGSIAHAQLTFGNGMIMLGSVAKGGQHDALIMQPEDNGLRETQSPCLIVSDAEPIYAQAKAAGATMVMELTAMDYGGKAFACRDLEGHLWSIGEYDPWEPQPMA